MPKHSAQRSANTSILCPMRCVGVVTIALLATGCEQRAPMVYVLEGPQEVTLTPSVDRTSVEQGGTVVLRVTRRASGQWKQIPRDQLRPGQCWVYRPPSQAEEEAGANVQWEVVPENAVQFAREYRMDRSREATMMARGTIKLTPYSPVTCEPERVIEGPPLYIQVS